MSRKTKEEAEKTRTRILASALSLFAKKGYDYTTFSDIAARLKLTKGAVYWHFDSKEDLLKELVRDALEKFRRQTEALMPEGELTFPAVADMMIRTAEGVVSDPKAAAFFRLMKCQIRWTDASMESVRHDLLNNMSYGPREVFRQAVINDIAAGRVKREVNPDEISVVVIAIWDGLVQARIDHFLDCDMSKTMRNTYNAIWANIRT